MSPQAQPKVLFVSYTFSHNAGRVVDVMAEALAAKRCDVTKAAIEFTDRRYAKRFSVLPMRHPMLEIVGMLPAQLRRATGEIRVPSEAQEGDYDLIVFGSPTWWLTTNMPIRSYLESPAAKAILDGKPFAAFSVSRRYWKGNVHTIKRLGEAAGGSSVGDAHFVSSGNQVKSMLSWLSYMKHGEDRERAFGLKIPPSNLQPGFDREARSFIDGVADQVLGQRVASVA